MKIFARKRFTIMETIAVMTIIILLTTVLLPILSKAREWGKSIGCKNNVRALASAINSYANDMSGVPPPDSGNQLEWVGIYPVRIGWVLTLLDPFSTNLAYAAYRTSPGAILRAPSGLGKGYVQFPKLKRLPRNIGGGYESLYLSPADYNTAFACPAERLEWRNEFLVDAAGITDPNDYTYAWYGSHYAVGPLRPLIYQGNVGYGKTIFRKNGQHTAWVGDSASSFYYGNSMLTSDRYIYGRHFGTPKTGLGAWSAGMGYREQGPGRANWAMMDGHVESWSWREFYNSYKPTSSSYATGPNPFYSFMW